MRSRAKKVVTDPASSDKATRWPPLYTADGEPMRVNQLLYSASFDENRYGEKRGPRAAIEVLRVTRLDLRYRTVRMRCARGCETFLQFNKGCSLDEYYSSKERAEKSIADEIAEAVKGIQDGIDKRQKRLDKIAKMKVAVAKTPPEELTV